MTSTYRCARCDRDLRLIVHKTTPDGRRWCLNCELSDEDGQGRGDAA
jgi:DNA-directed RNA polymerase subunit RPC12/RpoP